MGSKLCAQKKDLASDRIVFSRNRLCDDVSGQLRNRKHKAVSQQQFRSPITACQPPPSGKGRHARQEAFGAGKKLQGLEAGKMLQRTGKRSNQAYINARCDALHGRTAGFAIRNFRYYDNKRAAANYE